MNKSTLPLLAALSLLSGTASAQYTMGVNDPLIPPSLAPWVPNAVASTGLYVHQTQLQPADDITTTEQSNGFGEGIDRITVALPARLAASGKLFARLRVGVVQAME